MAAKDFIATIAPFAVRDWRERRIMLPSIVIAQCAKESGFGTSELAVNANALCGIKLNGWTGESYLKKADEMNLDGTMRTDPNALWRKYGSWEESVIDHNTYIAERKVGNQTQPNFKAVIGETNLKKAIAALVGNSNRSQTAARCTDPELKKYVLAGTTQYGYATGQAYVQSLLDDYIIKYNLTQYDGVEGEVNVSKTYKVFLSAGHGGNDPGASKFGLVEKDINLNALLACKAELERHGVLVVASRVKDENDPVSQEVNEANASGADIAVSFHANASGSGNGDGFEVFYWTASAEGKKLAQLCEKYVKQLGQNSRGLKSGNHLAFVKNTDMTSVLVESFFVDNDKDNDIGDTVEEQKAFGVAYAKAILEYLDIQYKATAAPKPTTATKLYRVYRQEGAYANRVNAEKKLAELQSKGYIGIIQ